MNVAITGSRDRGLTAIEMNLIRRICGPSSPIVGDCPTGVDCDIRKMYGDDARVFKADWDSFGNGAGPERNGRMVRQAVVLLAFPGPASKGTWDCVRQAQDYGLLVWICEFAR